MSCCLKGEKNKMQMRIWTKINWRNIKETIPEGAISVDTWSCQTNFSHHCNENWHSKKTHHKPPRYMFKKLLQVKASSNDTKKTRQKQLLQHYKIILIDTWEHTIHCWANWTRAEGLKTPSKSLLQILDATSHIQVSGNLCLLLKGESQSEQILIHAQACVGMHMSIYRKQNYTAPTQKTQTKTQMNKPTTLKKPKPPRNRERAP